MNKFKAGDKVRYVRAGAIGWELEDWAEGAGLVLGEKYTVCETSEEGESPSVLIEEDKSEYVIHPDHFELVEDGDIKAELLEALEYMLDINVIEADYRYGDACFKSKKAIAKAKGEQS